MLTFCDVLHKAKQKTQTNSRECAVRTGNNLYTIIQYKESGAFFASQIRKLQEVAKELETRMKSIYDDLAQREAEAEKLRQTIRNTPPNDPAYVCTYKGPNYVPPSEICPQMTLPVIYV